MRRVHQVVLFVRTSVCQCSALLDILCVSSRHAGFLCTPRDETPFQSGHSWNNSELVCAAPLLVDRVNEQYYEFAR